MPPEAIAFLRAAVTCALFWLLSLFLPRQRVTHRDLGLLAVCGICGVGINQLLFVVGLKMTSPVDGSIIASSTPIFALLLAAVILREPVTKRKVLGVMLGVCGGLLLVFGTAHATSGGSSLPGDAMIAVNYIVYSLYLVLSRSLAQRYSAETIMKWMFLVATVALFPFSAGELENVAVFTRGIPTDATLRVALYYGRLHIHRLSACHLLSEKPPADNGKHVQLRSADGSLRHCDSHRSGRIFNLKAGVAVACIHGCVSRHYKPPQA